MRVRGKIQVAVIASVLVAGAAADAESSKAPSTQAESPQDDDTVVSAAFERAGTLEEESPDEARLIYSGIIDRFPKAWCDCGPTSFRCAEAAQQRLRIMACREKRTATRSVPSSSELAQALVSAVRAEDLEALREYASCDFALGPCHTDVGSSDEPDAALACLVKIASRDARIDPAPDIEGSWAAYFVTPASGLALMLEQRESTRRWEWSGMCFKGENPCAAK